MTYILCLYRQGVSRLNESSNLKHQNRSATFYILSPSKSKHDFSGHLGRAADGKAIGPVDRLLGKGLVVLAGVVDLGDLLGAVLEDLAGDELEVAGELEAGDEEGAVLEEVGVGVGLAELDLGAVERNPGVAVGAAPVVGELHLDAAGGMTLGGRGDEGGEEGESEGDGGEHCEGWLGWKELGV